MKKEIEIIKGFKKLKFNWDSYNGLSINKYSIDNSINFLHKVSEYELYVEDVSHGPNGEVSILFKNMDKELEFIFYSINTFYVKYYKEDYLKQGVYTKDKLIDLVDWLKQ